MNLLSKLHKNSILTGPVESYCLACDCLLRSEEESYFHIHDPGHMLNFSTLQRLDNHNDCIIKTKDGYFCCYCNIILPTIKRVGFHVVEVKHRDNKNSQSITRHAGVILLFDTVIINDRSWNGLDGSTCSICNEDYDDEKTHKSGATHVLNLIQTKCEFGETYVYRKVDDELFFCLICNEILSISEKPAHHETEKHRDHYECSKREGSAIQKLPSIEPNNNFCVQTHDNKEAKENKAQNVIDNNKPTIQKINQELPVLNTELQASKKSKSDSEIKETHETTKLNTQDVKLASQNKSAQELKDKKPSLNSNSKDIEPKNTEAVTPKAETKKLAPADDETNGTGTVQTDDGERYIYEFLKARNFIIKAQDGKAYCTLCDIQIDDTNIGAHTRDRHHCILYAKHIARKTSQVSKIETVKEQENKTVSKTPKANGQLQAKEKSNAVSEKEKVASVNVKANQKAVSKTSAKSAEVNEKFVDSKESKENTVLKPTQEAVTVSSEKLERKESKSTTAETKPPVIEEANNKPLETAKASETKDKPKECELADKENKTPYSDDNIPLRESSNARNKVETKQESAEITIQPKKGTKKAQKKAAKAKASEAEASVLPKEVEKAEPSLPEVCGLGTSETANKEHNSITQSPTKILIDTNNTEAVVDKDAKDVETQEDNSEIMAARFASDADLTMVKIQNVLKTVSQVESSPDDVVINSKYVLGNLSFVLVVRTDDANEAECVACDEHLTIDDIHKHIVKDEHRTNVEDCPVVTSLNDEFIRQIKTDKYHCGYCNMLLQDWEGMKNHLDTYRHNDAKTSAAWRLERYRPHLRHCETIEVRSILTTIFRFTRE